MERVIVRIHVDYADKENPKINPAQLERALQLALNQITAAVTKVERAVEKIQEEAV